MTEKNVSPNSSCDGQIHKYVEVIEDTFGTHKDKKGKSHKIKRFTWTNQNRIKVQIITYGARITSIKVPDRKGDLSDIVMGFDDLNGYKQFDDLCFGSMLGRFASRLRNNTFVIDGKQHWLKSNPGTCNIGVFQAFDSVVWDSHVEGRKVVLSHISKSDNDGFPGDLLVRITFALSSKNDFSVDIEAFCTEPTIVNITNILYFNLAGHNTGPDELYRHIFTINANCYTPMDDDDFPTGDIKNVVHTPFDFQIPKLLGKVIGLIPGDGINQNLCVNRGVDQGDCFVARVLHSPSGRMLEIYSNQPGVNFSTANDVGSCMVDIPGSEYAAIHNAIQVRSVYDLVDRLHTKMAQTLIVDKPEDYSDLRDLIRKIHNLNIGTEDIPTKISAVKRPTLTLTATQVTYLESMRDLTLSNPSLTDYSEIGEIIQHLLATSGPQEALPVMSSSSPDNRSLANSVTLPEPEVAKEEVKQKGIVKAPGKKPVCYCTEGLIVGKMGANYKRHGAFCLQTQNYPNAVHYKNFPNCVLKPGETYKHTIVYRFWIKAGNPMKWIKRTNAEFKKQKGGDHV